MSDDQDLDRTGRAVAVHRRVSLRTPGMSGVARTYRPGTPDQRGPEQITEALRRSLAANDIEQDLTIEIRGAREHRLPTGTRGSGPGDMIVDVQDPGPGWEQVVLYQSEDGVLSWHFRDSEPAAELNLPVRYRLPGGVVRVDPGDGTTHRGLIGTIGVKVIRILVFRLVREGAGWAGAEFARAVESRRHPHRLRQFGPGDYTGAHRADLSAEALRHLASGRALLMIHGTFSTAHGGFGHLPAETLRELHLRYDGRIFAFEHPTVATTPVGNVRWLSERLRQSQVRLDLDVVCHSRGGLVGRVLSERPDLGDCGETISVGRVVMVGTPHAGTPLADVKRLEHLLGRFTTLLQLVPTNGVTEALDIVLALVKQVAAGVATGLDGLMAMNPASDFLTTQLTGRDARARYATAAAHYDPPAGGSLLRAARNGAMDLVFGAERNDLVVPTGSALADRTFRLDAGDRLSFEAADGVDHFGYFARTELSAALSRWLRG
ncbi:esterase/lipase family protein [Nocardia aurantia]|uniref:DUF7379 domain-containing protein n=1 Tax=Nocardia aurantia TaxID=2585199 RepID=A0A7K0DNU0_9NOCA|nr:hypothetical protein [Nocardia aurantia]MQY27389.1 hypothetical protein [Nocardia aurantia]